MFSLTSRKRTFFKRCQHWDTDNSQCIPWAFVSLCEKIIIWSCFFDTVDIARCIYELELPSLTFLMSAPNIFLTKPNFVLQVVCLHLFVLQNSYAFNAPTPFIFCVYLFFVTLLFYCFYTDLISYTMVTQCIISSPTIFAFYHSASIWLWCFIHRVVTSVLKNR